MPLSSSDGIPRAPPHGEESLRGAITADDWNFLFEQQPGPRAAGQDMLPFELLRCTSRLKQVALGCINGILTGDAPHLRSWLGGLVRFLLKKEDILEKLAGIGQCACSTLSTNACRQS